MRFAYMTQKNKGIGAVCSLVMFMLLAAFALLSMIAVLAGVRIYRVVEQRGLNNYETRTALSYIAGKVRAADTLNQIRVIRFDDTEALVLTAEYADTAYETVIYVYDGHLREFFSRTDAAFSPAHGEIIAEAQSFRCRIDGKLLTINITRADATTEETLTLFLQSGEVFE